MRSAPQDIPSRASDPWADEHEDVPFIHDSLDVDDLDSGPSSYLQTPPASSIDFILSPLNIDCDQHKDTDMTTALHIQLDDHLLSLSQSPRPVTTPVINLLTAGIGELAHALDKRELTSVRAIKMYLAQIDRLNGYLHALTYVAAREMLLEQARECDRIIRSEGFDRRQMPLCGIPVVVKYVSSSFVLVCANE